jgi:hypothetical protein
MPDRLGPVQIINFWVLLSPLGERQLTQKADNLNRTEYESYLQSIFAMLKKATLRSLFILTHRIGKSSKYSHPITQLQCSGLNREQKVQKDSNVFLNILKKFK